MTMPAGFEPTSTHRNWKGKIRCAYCRANGWPDTSLTGWPQWWGHRHGENCARKPPKQASKDETSTLREQPADATLPPNLTGRDQT